eukprot:s687_g6.t2
MDEIPTWRQARCFPRRSLFFCGFQGSFFNAQGRIKAGDRHGPGTIMRRSDTALDEEDFIPSAEDATGTSGDWLASQAMTVWHRQAMALAEQVLKDAKVEHLLDIGTSFNPLRHVFPHVTAIDVVPGDDTVLVADFLEVELLEDLKQVQIHPADSQRVTAVPTEHFDGALLSMVLRALSRSSASEYKSLRREMLRRAARCVRPGGVVVVIERSPLGVNHTDAPVTTIAGSEDWVPEASKVAASPKLQAEVATSPKLEPREAKVAASPKLEPREAEVLPVASGVITDG